MRTLLLVSMLAATPLFAVNDGAISLSPAVIMLRGEAGQSTTQTLLLANGTSRTLTFDVVAEDVIVRDGKRTFVAAGSIAGSIAATAVFSQSRVRILPGEKMEVTVTFTIPAAASHRAVAALFRGRDVIHGATASVGTLLTIALSDETVVTAEPLVVDAQTPTSNLTVAQAFRNTGREPLVARGMMAVLAADGKLAGKSPIAPRRLLPGERSELTAEYAGELRPGRYRVLLTYDYDGGALTQSAEIDVR